MDLETNQLRAAVNALARLLAETVTAVAHVGAFDHLGREHVSDLLEKADEALRAAHLRGADDHLREAKDAVENAVRDPRLLR